MVTVDASVWVAAAVPTETFHVASRTFLRMAAQQRRTFYLPAFAWLEITCALARRYQDGQAGRELAAGVLALPQIQSSPLDAGLLAQATQLGPRLLLRSGDALYAAVAELYAAQLISWDQELQRRAGAMTPEEWVQREG